MQENEPKHWVNDQTTLCSKKLQFLRIYFKNGRKNRFCSFSLNATYCTCIVLATKFATKLYPKVLKSFSKMFVINP